jgi:hypothetical protein
VADILAQKTPKKTTERAWQDICGLNVDQLPP